MNFNKTAGNYHETRPNVIVGGGVIGLLVAWHFARAGMSSVVFDRQSVGKESSWAGAGILAPLYPARYASLTPLATSSASMYSSIVQESDASSGITSELVTSGLLNLDEFAASAEAERSRRLSRQELRHIEPALAASFAAFSPEVAQIRNPRFLKSLKASLYARGVLFQEDTPITGFRVANGCLQAVESAKGSIETSCCVVAAGAWSGELLRSTELYLPIKPIRGQMISLRSQTQSISHIVVSNYQYLVPRLDGRILVGSTAEDGGYDKGPTADVGKRLHAFASSLVPSLRDEPIENHWVGLRPGSPDGAPFIGEHPAVKGLFVCSGHYRNGFAIGPASAQLVVEMALGQPLSFDPTPFRLDRPCPEWRI